MTPIASFYSYERVEPYRTLLEACWNAAGPTGFEIVTSELILLEVLVKPFRINNTVLEIGLRNRLASPDVRLALVTTLILERAAMLRATVPALITPDAIHAATAFVEGCSLLLTNDVGFRRVSGLSVTILSDLIIP